MTDLPPWKPNWRPPIAAAADLAALDAVRVAALGKTGSISNLLKSLGAMSPDERKTAGRPSTACATGCGPDRRAQGGAGRPGAGSQAGGRAGSTSTLPAPPRRKGSVHPTMQVFDELISIFAEMGFAVAEGPDIEDDFHNFTALNFPPKHPARDMHDTFFLREGPDGTRKVLRTHTSPVQVRTMMSQVPAHPHRRPRPHLS